MEEKLLCRITCKEDGTEFFFANNIDAEKFISVFKDHWCNISWNGPDYIEEKHVPSFKKHFIILDPITRAEKNLDWGFSLTKRIGIGLTSEQEKVLEGVMKGIVKK